VCVYEKKRLQTRPSDGLHRNRHSSPVAGTGAFTRKMLKRIQATVAAGAGGLIGEEDHHA